MLRVCIPKRSQWFEAAINDDVEILSVLQQEYAGSFDISNFSQRINGCCALHYAIMYENVFSVKALMPLEHELRTKSTIKNRKLMLGPNANVVHLALMTQNLEIINLVLDFVKKLAGFHHDTDSGQSPLEVFGLCLKRNCLHLLQREFMVDDIFDTALNVERNFVLDTLKLGNGFLISWLLDEFDNSQREFQQAISQYLDRRHVQILFWVRKLGNKELYGLVKELYERIQIFLGVKYSTYVDPLQKCQTTQDCVILM